MLTPSKVLTILMPLVPCSLLLFMEYKMDLEPLLAILLLLLTTLISTCSFADDQHGLLCRTSCGTIPIHYPFGIDEGCGSPYYRNLLTCSNSSQLYLRTPSGTYPVKSINYVDPHIVVADPSMWHCQDAEETDNSAKKATPFSLDTSTHFSLSPKNNYLFFNCNPDHVIVEPKPSFCDHFPGRCDSTCDSSSYLCRNLPGCPEAVREMGMSCCSYQPTASDSLRLMLRQCESYTSLYWRNVGANLPPYDQVPEFGIRIDFEIPVTTRCLQCQDRNKGGGTCGFDTVSRSFLCLCDNVGNVTTYCKDRSVSASHKTSVGVIAGATTVASFAGLAGAGSLVWYLRKKRTSKVVTCGVQSNENRLF